VNAKHERGAAAVEFALVVLPLMLIIVTIVSVGFVFNQQLAVTAAAREAVRHYAVSQAATPPAPTGAADAETIAAGLVDGPVTFSWTTLCSPTVTGDTAEVTVTTTVAAPIGGFEELIGLDNIQLSGVGTMRCGG
jgi:Flp pilus assembly protein TadG